MTVNNPQKEIDYALVMDDTSTFKVTYIGTALTGSIESNPVWKIKKIDSNSGIVITWADGNNNFDNIWNDRISLTYL